VRRRGGAVRGPDGPDVFALPAPPADRRDDERPKGGSSAPSGLNSVPTAGFADFSRFLRASPLY
jgi:hypothetical protein